jgi:hypothetical protein
MDYLRNLLSCTERCDYISLKNGPFGGSATFTTPPSLLRTPLNAPDITTMLVFVALFTALLPAFSGLVAAATADGIDFFQIQQANILDFTNFATHELSAGLGFPRCDGFTPFETVREESLPYYQFATRILHIPGVM